jgi:hypothetical protein
MQRILVAGGSMAGDDSPSLLSHQAGLLDEIDKSRGQNHPELRVLSANQRFGAADAARAVRGRRRRFKDRHLLPPL